MRVMAALSCCKQMVDTYKEGKDVYVLIAQQIFHNNYEDNLEFYPEGTVIEVEGKKIVCGKGTNVNIEGKKRRSVAKMVALATNYGMGAKTLSERINTTVEEAQSILDNFFKNFPEIKKFIDAAQNSARTKYYVEDYLGRRRRLPDASLPPYEVYYTNEKELDESCFNPILGCKNKQINDSRIKYYLDKCNKCKGYSDVSKLKQEAEKEGITIFSNTSKIALAERQATNAIIQGSSATLTKTAMVHIDNNEELKKLGFKLLLTIHDEVIGECPAENAETVGEILSNLMVGAAKGYLDVPFKCDAEISEYWYQPSLEGSVLNDYKKQSENNDEETSFKNLCEIHSEFTPKQLKEVLDKQSN